MSSRMGTTGSSSSTKRNMTQTRPDKKSNAPLKTTAAEKRNPGVTQPHNIVAAVSVRITEIERQHMIQEAAYYRAEQRGFRSGDEMRDWLEAEAEINHRFPQ